MCMQRAMLVERRVCKLSCMKVMHPKSLSSETLVPTKFIYSLAALMISPYSTSKYGMASIPATISQMGDSLPGHGSSAHILQAHHS
jgi:hypothetical protein